MFIETIYDVFINCFEPIHFSKKKNLSMRAYMTSLYAISAWLGYLSKHAFILFVN